MDYESAKRTLAIVTAAERQAAANLRAVRAIFPEPNGPMNLVPDHIRTAPEYRAAKLAYDQAFGVLRHAGGWFNKAFAKEIRAERKVEHAKRLEAGARFLAERSNVA